MISRQGRVEVLNDPECQLFPWHPRPVLELSESNAVQLHEGPCLVLFVGEWTGIFDAASAAPHGAQELRVLEWSGIYVDHIECQTLWKMLEALIGPKVFGK